MSLIRIPFLISAMLGAYAMMTPPGVGRSSAKKLKPTGVERLVPIMPFLGKLVYLLPIPIEIAVIIAHANPSSSVSAQILTTFVRNDGDSASKIRLSTSFLLGWLVSIAGTFLRLKCYRVLGDFFTFELAVHKEHKLITSGPYAVVRHPSYTAVAMVVGGTTACLLSPGSWLTECSGVIGSRGAAFMTFGNFAVCIAWLFVRMRKEDAMLREQFGTRWEEWARQVRYKLVPGVC
jgi:protein-S-isoprenylcysteine O-methyltransferase Ste14